MARAIERHKARKLPCKLCGATDAPIAGAIILDEAWFKRMGLKMLPFPRYAIISLCPNCLSRPDLNKAEDEVVADMLRKLQDQWEA